MKKKSDVDIFNATNSLKILSFLVKNPGKDFLGSEIQKSTSLSRAGVYIALRELVKQKLVYKTQKGKFLMYSVIFRDPVIKQFKVLENIILLRSIIFKLKPLSKKIVLYGSASRGEDDENSDIDLFVLSNDFDTIKNLLSSLRLKRKIQAIIKSPSELAEFIEKEPIFNGEINMGISLWEESE